MTTEFHSRLARTREPFMLNAIRRALAAYFGGENLLRVEQTNTEDDKAGIDVRAFTRFGIFRIQLKIHEERVNGHVPFEVTAPSGGEGWLFRMRVVDLVVIAWPRAGVAIVFPYTNLELVQDGYEQSEGAWPLSPGADGKGQLVWIPAEWLLDRDDTFRMVNYRAIRGKQGTLALDAPKSELPWLKRAA